MSLLYLFEDAALAGNERAPAVGAHQVGLADSRVGYESPTYVTDSRVVIQLSESGSG